MKHSKRLTAILIAVVMVLAVFPAHAGVLRYTHTRSISAYVGFDGDLATCEGSIDGQQDTTKVAITLSLVRDNGDGTYKTVKTWDKETSNSYELITSKSYYVLRGYSYYVHVAGEVTRNGTTEYVSCYSGAGHCN
jgi:hypothetical protein